MRYFNRLLSGLLILCLAAIMLAGCTPTSNVEPSPTGKTIPSPDTGDNTQLQELQVKYDELSTKYDNLEIQLDISQVNYDKLTAKYEDLSTKYEKLSEEHDALLMGIASTGEEELEQMLFEAVNQLRRDNELDELEWNNGLYKWAKQHSRDMAERKRLEYSEYSYWQEIFLAVGYSTGDRVVQAALTTWQQRAPYEANFLNKAAELATVGVVKSDDMYYITYFADVSR